jgi:NIPSNAP
MILEIRTYRLAPGTRDEFVRLMREESTPLLERYGIRVVGCGASLVSEDGHDEAYLVRAFPSLEAHAEQEARFYGSDDWRSGPRENVLACIESYHTVVVEISEAAVAALSIDLASRSVA